MPLRVGRPLLVLACAAASLAAQSLQTRGPAYGHLVLDGGGVPDSSIIAAFAALAGGSNSHIILIPTASGPDTLLPEMARYLARRNQEIFGVARVTVLHTRDRAEADRESFVEPFQRATGVWFLGGFPERLVESYSGTRTERAIRELLDRGGVVGGMSAGAMIQASWLDTTAGEWTPHMRAVARAQGRGGGLGLLTRAAVFPHFNKRGDKDAVRSIAAHPELLAVGIDESTALIVSADNVEVIGRGVVKLYDAKSGASKPVVLRSGDKYDLVALLKH